jgi:mannose-6-phosphate isomerase-like protein (cupin superfamily)
MNIYEENRPWGKFEVFLDSPGCKLKKITVSPSQQLSYQYHNYRAEHWVVVEGSGELIKDDLSFPVYPGYYAFIDVKQKHRIKNTGDKNLVLIEVQFGEKCIEEDIFRIEDDYERN